MLTVSGVSVVADGGGCCCCFSCALVVIVIRVASSVRNTGLDDPPLHRLMSTLRLAHLPVLPGPPVL